MNSFSFKQLFLFLVAVFLFSCKEPVSMDAYLQEMSFFEGDLSPSFDPETFQYELRVPSSTEMVTVKAKPRHPEAVITSPVSFYVGSDSDVLVVTVAAADGQTIIPYKVSVLFLEPSSDASLRSLSLSAGILEPRFDPNISSYSVVVENNIDQIEITAETGSPRAQATGLGSYNLYIGANEIPFYVRSEDTKNMKRYLLRVIRKSDETNLLLSELGISGCTLVPVFDPNVTDYTAEIPYNDRRITIGGTPQDSRNTVTGLGWTPFEEDEKTIEISVSSKDGLRTKTYVITAVRYVRSSEARLKSISLPPSGELKPAFDPDIYFYEVILDSPVSKISISGETIGLHARTSDFGEISLRSTPAVRQVRITAEDDSRRIYTVSISRPLFQDTDLYSLTYDVGALDPPFTPNVHDYTLTVPKDCSSVTLSATTRAVGAQKWNIYTSGGGSTHQYIKYTLHKKTTRVGFRVDAEDRTIKSYYWVNIIKG